MSPPSIGRTSAALEARQGGGTKRVQAREREQEAERARARAAEKAAADDRRRREIEELMR